MADDRRFRQLFEAVRGAGLPGFLGGVAADRSAAAILRPPGGSDRLRVGTVAAALPGLNWYKVQTSEGGSRAGAYMGGDHGFLNGSRLQLLAPGSAVLYHEFAALPYVVILGPLPAPRQAQAAFRPGVMAPGFDGGWHRSPGWRSPLENCLAQGGVLDFGAGRPRDELPGDLGFHHSLTGSLLAVGPWESRMGFGEACELAFFWHHLGARLSGLRLELEAPGWAARGGGPWHLPEHVEGWSCHAAEDLGARADAAEAFDVQPDDATGQGQDGSAPRCWLEPGAEPGDFAAAKPFRRLRRVRGFRAQGEETTVVLPPASGSLNPSRGAPPTTVFHEHLALDGSRVTQSAKGLYFVKAPFLGSPWERRDPYVPGDGEEAPDDPRDLDAASGPAEPEPAAGATSFLDLAARLFFERPRRQWRRFPGEVGLPGDAGADAADLSAWTGPRGWDQGRAGGPMPEPEPAPRPVDHAWGTAAYYRRMSFLAMLEKGELAFVDGYGNSLESGPNGWTLASPFDVRVATGRDVALLAGRDAQVFARRHVGLTANEGSLRAKAEADVSVLGGAGGAGGVLVESRGLEPATVEDGVAQPAGLVLKAAGDALVDAGELALRGGNVLVDAGGGQGALGFQGAAERHWLGTQAAFSFGAMDETAFSAQGTSTILSAQGLATGAAQVDGDLMVSAAAYVGSAAYVGGQVLAEAFVESAGLGGELRSQMSEPLAEAQSTAAAGNGAAYADLVAAAWRAEGRLGGSAVRAAMGFRFHEAAELGTTAWTMAAPYWTQLRMELPAADREAFAAVAPRPVDGTWPWPGAEAWTGTAWERPADSPLPGLRPPEPGGLDNRPRPAIEKLPLQEGLLGLGD